MVGEDGEGVFGGYSGREVYVRALVILTFYFDLEEVLCLGGDFLCVDFGFEFGCLLLGGCGARSDGGNGDDAITW